MSEIRYTAWGEGRYASGATPTDYKYTGQMQLDNGIYFYGARNYDPLLGRFLTPDSILPGVRNPIAFDRYAGMFNNPTRYTDPSGHSVCDVAGADPECRGLRIRRRSEPPKPPVKPSTGLSSTLSNNNSGSNDHDLPFDPGLGGNCETDPGYQSSDEKPSVIALILIGIPLSVATVIVDSVLVLAEVALIDATLTVPALAPATVTLGLVIAMTGLAITDLDVAYWVYTARVANAPDNETIKFEFLPPWGLGK